MSVSNGCNGTCGGACNGWCNKSSNIVIHNELTKDYKYLIGNYILHKQTEGNFRSSHISKKKKINYKLFKI